MAVCKAMGARRIIAVDVSQGRLDFAKQYAATDIHLASPMNEGEDRGAYSKRHVRMIYDPRSLSRREVLEPKAHVLGSDHLRKVWPQ